jgi:hypothetical protein
VPDWTTYAKDQMLAVTLGADDPPDQLYVALYTNTADPSAAANTGANSDELTLPGYTRQPVFWARLAGNPGQVVNQVEVTFSFGDFTTGHYTGVAILDDVLAGNVWFWNDASSPTTLEPNTETSLPAGAMSVVRSG